MSTLLKKLDSNASVNNADEVWQVLVVDDDRDIHALTSIILNDFQYQDKPLRIHYAKSTEQAKQMLTEMPTVHLVLLDMVMEDRDSGLSLIQFIREKMKNLRTQIVVRTALRERLPTPSLLEKYLIVEARVKSDMTAHVFRESIYNALDRWQACGKKSGFDKEFLVLGLTHLRKTKLSDEQDKIVRDLLHYLNP